MKLNSRGWGYRMMILLMSILIIFLFVAIYYIHNYYSQINGDFNRVRSSYIGE